MAENLIKSKKRVQQHGEVFTPAWMVEKMLSTPGIKEATEDIYATFLEPSAGDGNFLRAILVKKLQAVIEKYDPKYWQVKSLIAVTSIYGIEYLADNLEMARVRMLEYYIEWYEENLGVHLSPKDDIYKSAKYIIHRNVVRGDTLKKVHPETGEPIVFIEWKQERKKSNKVIAVPFAFMELFDEEMVEYDPNFVEGQLDLFADKEFFVEENTETKNPERIDIRKVYQLGESK